MNTACSTCLELFTSKSDISTTPCGHVFHTNCITKWLENGQNDCSECRKECTANEIIKLYFSEGEPEDNLINELQDENLKLQEDANASKSCELEANQKCLKLQEEVNVLKSHELKLKEENLNLSKHLRHLQTNWTNQERNLKQQCKELTEKLKETQKMVSD